MKKEIFHSQPEGISWPTKTWPRRELNADEDASMVDAVIDELFGHGVNPVPGCGVSLALLVVAGGQLVREKYGTIPGGVFAPEIPVHSEMPLVSWSMAKSITHALTGLMVDDGLISTTDVTGISEWSLDQRARITIDHLLQMRDGLDFVEEYVIDAEGKSASDVIAMLFGEGSSDVAAYAKSRLAKHEPGEVWSYSSGTTNILASLLGGIIGSDSDFEKFISDRLFVPLGMSSARATFDTTGTFVGSSYVHATAQDFARFGYLYLRGGLWASDRILTAKWINEARVQHATDPESGHGYGSHWWTWKSYAGTLAALGYEGQRTIIDYGRDVVIVHLGKWPAETQSVLDGALSRIMESFPAVMR